MELLDHGDVHGAIRLYEEMKLDSAMTLKIAVRQEAKEDMKLLKKEWLPKLIMTSPDEFDAAWDHYVDMYNSRINVKAYEKQLDIEIQNRMKNRIK